MHSPLLLLFLCSAASANLLGLLRKFEGGKSLPSGPLPGGGKSVPSGLLPGQSSMCKGGVFTDAERMAILNAHNSLRSKLAMGTYVAKGVKKPAARNMRKMVYDCGLEATAQKWADTCPSGHSGTPGNGENMFWTGDTSNITTKGTSACGCWESQFQNHEWKGLNYAGQVGHATQMGWAESYKIGCGMRICKDKKWTAVVCQYWPAGNYPRAIYEEGLCCSNCPNATSCEKPSGLCK